MENTEVMTELVFTVLEWGKYRYKIIEITLDVGNWKIYRNYFKGMRRGKIGQWWIQNFYLESDKFIQ